MKIIDLTDKTPKQLMQLLEIIKLSDADDETKLVNMQNIEFKLYGRDNTELIKEIEAGMADISDING